MDDLDILREQTLDFIDAYPLGIVLRRDTLTADGAGGYRAANTSLRAQTFRQVTQPTNNQSLVRQTIDGREVSPDFVLICPYDADIEVNDTYLDDDDRIYEIIYVRADNRYEKWAEVSYRG